MKVMIDMSEEELRILKAVGKVDFSNDDDNFKQCDILFDLFKKVYESYDAWSDPTTETVIGASTLSELSLQKQLIFDPHTKVSLQKPGAYLVFPQQQSVMHLFSVGPNHTGYLVMSLQAWEALGNLK